MKIKERPKKVTMGIGLLWVSLSLGIIRITGEILYSEDINIALAITIPIIILIGLLIYMIGKRKDWARITFLVLFIISIPSLVTGMLYWLKINPVLVILRMGETTLTMVALIFIFSSKWFE